MRGVILAAGFGIRFLPATKTVPKEMLPLIDRPSISFIIDEFIDSGIDNILIVISRRKRALEDWFDHEPEVEELLRKQGNRALLRRIEPIRARVEFVRQRSMEGTGHALLLAESFADGQPIVVAYPDDIHLGDPPLGRQLIDKWHETGCAVLATIEDPPDLHRYAVVGLSADGEHVEEIVEKPPKGTEPSSIASIGRFLYPPKFFHYLREGWERHKKMKEHAEYYHIYALRRLIEEGGVIHHPMQGERLDVGEPIGYLRAIARCALQTQPYRQALLQEVARASSSPEDPTY